METILIDCALRPEDEAAGLNYAFAPEFRELGQSIVDGPAYHGQATLTTLPIRSMRILRFLHQTDFWKPWRLLISSVPLRAD